MILTLEALAVAGMLAVTTTPMAGTTTGMAPPPEPVVLELDARRLALTGSRGEPRRLLRFAAGLGASLAWDLADLPRRQARLPDPIGGFRPGAALRAHLGEPAVQEGGAIGSLITRWNSLYPPYALEVMNDR